MKSFITGGSGVFFDRAESITTTDDAQKNDVDMVVIGAGPAGYVCAIRAAQLGLRVVLVEKDPSLGGTCLNVGCIPSKALLESSERFVGAKNHLGDHGVNVSEVTLNLPAMMKRKDSVVSSLTRGVKGLMRKNKITVVEGVATIDSPEQVRVKQSRNNETLINARRGIVIATGSSPALPPRVDITLDDNDGRIVSSTGALSFSQVPQRLVVIGAGVIGLEMGSVWQRLGSKVDVVEFAPTVLPNIDPEAGTLMQRLLTKNGWTFHLGSKVVSAKVSSDQKTVTVVKEDVKNSEQSTIIADRVLVAVGRSPHVQGLGLSALGVKQDKRGFISVDDQGQTSVPGIYAVGDVTGGLMLAHEASDEGLMVADVIASGRGFINRAVIPNVVYTMPEIATVGMSERDIMSADIPFAVGKFPMAANARAIALGETNGFVKIYAHKDTDEVLGAVVVAPFAGSLIQEIATAMEFGGSSEDIARTCHGHPTLVEAVREAAHMTAFGHAINF